MKEEIQPAVYIISNGPRGTIYTGVTSGLWNRVATHKDGGIEGFSKQYDINNLVWYEHHISMEAAIRREKRIKIWNRDWKINMIEKFNSTWIDVHDDIDPTIYYVEEKLGSRLRGNDGLGGGK